MFSPRNGRPSSLRWGRLSLLLPNLLCLRFPSFCNMNVVKPVLCVLAWWLFLKILSLFHVLCTSLLSLKNLSTFDKFIYFCFM